jgi:trans-aconitate methyltransferase
MDRQSRWNRVYETKKPDTVNWYESRPNRSLEYVRRYSNSSQQVIDVGAGASSLTGALLDVGYVNPIALDISEAGLERAEAQLGVRAKLVTWIVADVTKSPELPPVDLWHDRAVLHFLTDEVEQVAYARLAAQTVKGFGHLVVAAFAPDGLERGNGLLVQRYDGSSLAKLFADSFDLVEVTSANHYTPSGEEKRFTWAVFRRRASELHLPRRSCIPERRESPSEGPV